MKKFTLSAALTLITLWLVPQTMKAQCEFIPDLFPGQSADRTELEVEAIVHVGEGANANLRDNHVISSLTSSAENKVTTFRDGVYFVGAGDADVTYTESVPRTECTWNHIIHYTVEKGIPTAYFRGLDGMEATALTVAYSESSGEEGGAEVDGAGTGGTYVPSPLMQYKQYSNGHFAQVNIPTSEITYSSTNEAVATIANGAISVKGLGVTTLSASWDGNTNWGAASTTLLLTVKKDPNLSFSPSLINDSVGKVIPLHVNTPEGVTISRWTSTNANIASVDNEGNVTLKLPGSVNIYAIFDGNEEYAAGQCACQVTVAKADPHITFTPEVIRLEKDVDEFEAPVMNKPADLTETYSTTYQWSASDPYGVASVNAQTGAITLLGGTGTATIIYVFKGDVRYNAQNARYYIEVTTSGITVMGEYVKSNKPDVLGDGSVIYSNTIEGPALELHKDVFDANGGTFIQTEGGVLRILVNGNCEIKNAAKAIDNPSGAVFIWCQNRKDTITINATHSAISAADAKIHDCYLFANGGNYGLNLTSSIGVSAGGYIFASGATEAIRARQFNKGEDNIGGIEVLTKGVEYLNFEQAKDHFGGFYTDVEKGTKASFVELGKVPLPVKDDEVTDIDFQSENPDENLDVVFSGSEDDTFNEAEGQIEINTTTNSETLENTLSLYVTCSSDWLKALPGVLVFDVPAGEGKFGIQCDVAAGFHVEAFIEGVGEAKIDAPKDGWIEVQYNVAQQTHVIIYLQEGDNGRASAPARIAKAKKATPSLAIKSITITPKDASTGIENTNADKDANAVKFLYNGQIYILRGDKTYTLQGQELK